MGTIVAIIVGILAAWNLLAKYIDNQIENKLSESSFIRAVGSHVHPSIIFDSRGSILNDLGGMAYIEKLDVQTAKNSPMAQKIVLTPKSYLASPPILTTSDALFISVVPTRGKGIDWEFIVDVQMDIRGPQNVRFRLEIVP